eukprot:7567567-Pyramimonas_sp.AAC.1
MLYWPTQRVVNEMVRLAKPDGGTRLITLVESFVRLWARARRPIARTWLVQHGSPFIWGNRRGHSSRFSAFAHNLEAEIAASLGESSVT